MVEFSNFDLFLFDFSEGFFGNDNDPVSQNSDLMQFKTMKNK